MSNVFSLNQALEAGHNHKDYSYFSEDIPEGIYEARLDFKIWSKNLPGIDCYFTKKESGEKIRLTVHRDRKTKEYTLGDVDFRDLPTEVIYKVEAKINSKGNSKFVSATRL